MTRAIAFVCMLACGSSPPPKLGTSPADRSPVAAAATSWDKLEGTISKIEVEARDPKLASALIGEIERVFAAERGQALDRSKLRDRLDAAMKLPGVAELALRGVQVEGGIHLVVEVTAQPTLHAITAKDSTGKIIPLPADAPKLGGPLDPQAIGKLTLALRDGYREEGYLTADASWGTRPAETGAVDVMIEVASGEQVRVGKVEVKGSTLPIGDLIQPLAKILVTGEPVGQVRLNRATLTIADIYYDRGYPNVQVSRPMLTGSGPATITFTVEEGGRFKLGTLAITGGEPKLAKRYLRVTQLKKGDWFNRSAIRDASNRLREAARQDGMQNAEVLPLTNVDLAKKTIGLTFEVTNR